MIHKMAGFLLRFFQVDTKVDKERLQICLYGMEILISTFFSVIWVMIIGIIGEAWLESIIFLAGFAFLRKQTGGYHAGSYFTCNLSLIVCYSVLLYLYKITVKDMGWTAMTVIFFVHFVTWYFVMPVENENKPLTNCQRRKGKKYSLFISLAYVALSAVCLLGGFRQGTILLYTIALIDVLALISIIKRRLFHHEKQKSN